MAREVTLVDAGLGNLASVERALIQVGAGVRVTSDPDKVATSRMVVFPGQSAFGAATRAIVDGAMGAALKMVVERGDPFLGICLGMQLLFDGSDENGGAEGLHVLPGWCRRFPDEMLIEAETGAIERDNEPAEPIEAGVPQPQSTAPFESESTGEGEPRDSEAEPEPRDSEAEPEPRREAEGQPDLGETALPDEARAAPVEAPAIQAPFVARAVGADAARPSVDLSAAPAIEIVPAIVPAPEPGEPLQRRLKVPHMGWNSVEPTGEHYYFVHSYYVEPEKLEDVMWMTTYGSIRFPAAVRRGNVMGCQFHPEKSQRAGLRFLRAFLLGGWG